MMFAPDRLARRDGAAPCGAWVLSAVLAFAVLPSAAFADPPSSDALGPNDAGGYLRVREREGGILSLQVLTRTFVPVDGNGPRIHLAGAIHIADKSYYERMQKRLDANDLVLFEGVRPPGTGEFSKHLDDAGRVEATRKRMQFLVTVIMQYREREGSMPESLSALESAGSARFREILPGLRRDAWGGKIRLRLIDVPAEDDRPARVMARLTSRGSDGERGGVGTAADITVDSKPVRVEGRLKSGRSPNIQEQLAKALGLSFQLHEMNSGKPNWRSSDIDMDELQMRLEKAGGDSALILKMLDGESIITKIAGFLLSLIANSPQTTATMKMVMIDVLASSESLLGGRGAGKAMGMLPGMDAAMGVILTDRNAIVIRDLKAAIKEERKLRDIAVFYGAGHMRDLEHQLLHELRYEPERDLWTTAIRVDPRDTGMPMDQVRQMRSMMRNMIERRLKSQ